MKKIKDLYHGDRPREKMLKNGKSSLTTKELIALILGSGSSKRDVMEIAGEIAKIFKQKQDDISIKELSTIKGIGTAKSCQLIASLELWNRLIKNDKTKIKITSAENVVNITKDIALKKQEHLVLITLDGANNLINKRVIFIGTLNSSIIHPREIFAEAITDRAASIIIAHNHPSGNREPSNEDILTTERIKQAGKLLGINLLDHIIVTKDSHTSLKACGYL